MSQDNRGSYKMCVWGGGGGAFWRRQALFERLQQTEQTERQTASGASNVCLSFIHSISHNQTCPPPPPKRRSVRYCAQGRTCGVWEGIEEPQAGQPANGWRKDRNGRTTLRNAMRSVSFKQVLGRKRQ